MKMCFMAKYNQISINQSTTADIHLHMTLMVRGLFGFHMRGLWEQY